MFGGDNANSKGSLGMARANRTHPEAVRHHFRSERMNSDDDDDKEQFLHCPGICRTKKQL